jgi:hypothetical protein
MNSISKLRCVGTILCVTLIAVNIKIIRAGRSLDMLIIFNGVEPKAPSASRSWILPASVVFHDSAQPDHPGRKLDVNKGEMWTKEEGTIGIAGCNNLLNLVLQLLCVLGLLVKVLSLKQLIERRYNTPIDLWRSVWGYFQGKNEDPHDHSIAYKLL